MDRTGCQAGSGRPRQIPVWSTVTTGTSLRRQAEVPDPRSPRKAARQTPCCPYRIPTLVGWETSPQVDERTSVKELGNLTPYLRKKGYPGSFLGLQCRRG